MNASKDRLKDKVIDRVNTMSLDKLENIDKFIDELENNEHSRRKILSFAGVWQDIDEETFQDLTKHLHVNRQKGSRRIYG